MRKRSALAAGLLAQLETFLGRHGVGAQNASPPVKALPPTMIFWQQTPPPSVAPAVVIDAPSAPSDSDRLKIAGAGSPKGALAPIGMDAWQEADRPWPGPREADWQFHSV